MLLTSFAHSFGQKKTVVVVIDTLVGNSEDFFYASFIAANDYTIGRNGQLIPIDDSSVAILPNNTHPHIVLSIVVSPASDLLLPLDTKHGRFTIKNIDKLDTLRIAKWEILKNDLPDTTIAGVCYYRMINDSFVREPYKCKADTSYSDPPAVARSKINTVINNISYSVPISTLENGSVSNGHGYTPDRKYKKYMKLYHSGKLGKRRIKYTRLHVHSLTKYHEYYGELSL